MKPLKILLIDDDKDDQFFFERTVKSFPQSIVCDVAGDGFGGLDYLLKNALPDIIFLDLNMPLMNGFDFLKVIKSDDNLKHIPIIIFTTSNHQTDIAHAEQLKAFGFLTKPNNLNNLSRLLLKALHLDFTINAGINIIY